MLIVGLTLALVTVALYLRLEDIFHQQEYVNLGSRTSSVQNILKLDMERAAGRGAVVSSDGRLNPAVEVLLNDPEFIKSVTNGVAQGDLTIRVGRDHPAVDAPSVFVPTPGATFTGQLVKPPERGQARDDVARTDHFPIDDNPLFPWALEVTISNPYTYRASTLAAIGVLLAVTALFALLLAVVVAAVFARRFTTPLRRLTETTTALASGDLSRRVPDDVARTGATEIAELSRQFNAMAERLQESVEMIRRDRDRSRDFLADVSHELRTPISALRTFNELLQEGARDDPAARAEFLEASAQQLERLDWLAQNLLELSKLDSGLVLLDLRPDDLRAAVESAVEQAQPTARRRGIALTVRLPDRPVRIRHDPPRLGQVVTNLLGNALKFTPRGGSVSVELQATRDGAQIVVRDTGVGIDPDELPHIFDRFYRGAKVAEARGAGSGLGLAIVKSVVDMHGGRVAVVSRPGDGATFTVSVPRDPRAADLSRRGARAGRAMPPGGEGQAPPDDVRADSSDGTHAPRGRRRTSSEVHDVAISSPGDESKLNTQPSG